MSQAGAVIVGDAIAIASAYYLLMCLSLIGAEYFSNPKRKSVSKSLCIFAQ